MTRTNRRQLFLQSIRYIEWVLGSVTLTIIAIQLAIRELANPGKTALLILVTIYFTASLLRQLFDPGLEKEKHK